MKTRLIGSTAGPSSPRRASSEWMSARPTRPLPSANGWIVSNCAWTSPARIRAGCRPSDAYVARSASSPSTADAGGGTKAASSGFHSLPPSQVCTVRGPMPGCSGNRVRCRSTMPFTVIVLPWAASVTAWRSVAMVWATSRALTLKPSMAVPVAAVAVVAAVAAVAANSARATCCGATRMPSIRADPMASERSRKPAARSRLTVAVPRSARILASMAVARESRSLGRAGGLAASGSG